MTPRQKKRFTLVGLVIAGTTIAVLLALKGFQQSITYFVVPSDIYQGQLDTQAHYRIGGTVKVGSVSRLDDGITMRFTITDCLSDVHVIYNGILPDLFREGQGIVADGNVDAAGLFTAQQVLAKHDENYVPAELAEEMLAKQMQQCEKTGEA
jgi:cytochrome c-type biogenesis protein CcmE